jgi:hypothetical protein
MEEEFADESFILDNRRLLVCRTTHKNGIVEDRKPRGTKFGQYPFRAKKAK